MSRSYEVLVIGGGQAGLAVGYHLAARGRHFVILDAADEPAATWRERWDSLRLFTPVRYDSLPGLPFPGDPDAYPTRDQVVDYITTYARHFELPVELSSRVTALRGLPEGGFAIDANGRTVDAQQVIVATGPFQTPVMPKLAQDLDAGVAQMHSSRYRSPANLPAGRVLIVGGGNTGYQIAEELVRSHEVHLAVGTKQTPLPQRLLGRDLFRYLHATGLMDKTVDSRMGQKMRHRETLIGSSPRRARRAGVKRHPRAVAADGRRILFQDGSSVDADAIIWATGFRRDHEWIHAPAFDEAGEVEHERGVTPYRGLYFLGMPWQHTRGSALLGWVGADAAHIAAQVEALARRL